MPIQIKLPGTLETAIKYAIPSRYRKLQLVMPGAETIYSSGNWGMLIHQQVPIDNHLYSEQYVTPLVDMELYFATTEPAIVLQIILSDNMEITYPDGNAMLQGKKIGLQYMLPDMPYKVNLYAGRHYHTAYIRLSPSLLEGLCDAFPLLHELFNSSSSLLLPFERFSAPMRTELSKMKNSMLNGKALIQYSNNRISDVVISYLEHVHRSLLHEAEVGILAAKVDHNPENTFNMAEQAQLFGLTERSLEVAFRQQKGTTLLLYVQQQRILKAKLLLLSSSNAISGIALEVGYADPSYFNRVFKQATGVSPGKYRSDGLL